MTVGPQYSAIIVLAEQVCYTLFLEQMGSVDRRKTRREKTMLLDIFLNIWATPENIAGQILLDMAGAWCGHAIGRSLVGGLLETIRLYVRTGEFAVDISVGQLVLWLMVWAVCVFCAFLLTRITYLKICGSLRLESGVLKVGTFLFPQIFLLIDYMCWRKKRRHLSKA